jgi:DNA-binding MarR family transcriptional regulator
MVAPPGGAGVSVLEYFFTQLDPEYLYSNDQGAALGSLARDTGLTYSSVSQAVRKLVTSGFLVQNHKGRSGYRKCFDLQLTGQSFAYIQERALAEGWINERRPVPEDLPDASAMPEDPADQSSTESSESSPSTKEEAGTESDASSPPAPKASEDKQPEPAVTESEESLAQSIESWLANSGPQVDRGGKLEVAIATTLLDFSRDELIRKVLDRVLWTVRHMVSDGRLTAYFKHSTLFGLALPDEVAKAALANQLAKCTFPKPPWSARLEPEGYGAAARRKRHAEEREAPESVEEDAQDDDGTEEIDEAEAA